MNRLTLLAALISGSIFITSCSDDSIDGPKGPALSEGDEVEFNLTSDRSRTMYQDDWDAKTNQELYWGNYINTEVDQIKIFCYQGARQIATYKVNPQTTGNSAVADGIEKTGSYGIQWGKSTDTHNFYAFYPASAAGNAFIGSSPSTIRATVGVGQSPVTYKAVEANGTAHTDNALSWVNSNNTQSVDNAVTIYGQPDMSAAIMVAKTEVSADGYGQPVGLSFNVLADVLDISINGPVVPNTLGGNQAQVSRNHITINSVRIEAKDGKTPICGNFDLNMETGEATNVSGNTAIQLVTAQTTSSSTLRPVLWVRYDTKDKAPTAAQIDHLRLRAFLIPGKIKNLNELKIVLSTDCGEFTQDLGDSQMASGKIHPIKLGYFKQRGTEFDFTNWISQLDPNIYISELSLPGTWHSSVANFQGTNNTNLQNQYKAGIRAFEVHAYNDTKNVEVVTSNDYAITFPTEESTKVSEEGVKRSGNGSSGTCTATSVTYTKTRTITQTKASSLKMSLYNYYGNADLKSSLTNLHKLINDGAFAVVEIGMEGQGAVTVTADSRTTTWTSTYTATNVSGTYTRDQNYNYNYNYTWDVNPVYPEYGDPNVSESSTTTFDGFSAWVQAVANLCSDLATTGVVYDKEITTNTTIKDVAGKIIIKVNTNNIWNETGWPANTPAIFSRWSSGSESAPLTVGLNWGQPASTTVASNPMRWCFTELDNIGSNLNNRKSAVNQMNDISIANFNDGTHSTWYECMIGGYLNGSSTAANCQAVAQEMNPYLIQVLSDPNRQACPLGLIFMNYALDDTYSGPDLIRTIINNNAAFILARAGDSSSATQASEKHNASYSAAPGNALK